MKKYVIIPVFVLFGLSGIFAQTCNDAKIMALKNAWVFRKATPVIPNISSNSKTQTSILKKAETIKKLFLDAYPVGVGGSVINNGVGYLDEYSEYAHNGIAAYTFSMTFYPFWCNKSKGNRLVTDKAYLTDVGIDIFVNHGMSIMQAYGDAFVSDGKPIKLFRLAHQLGTFQNMPLYDGFGKDHAFALLFTHDNQLPYRELSQREYLTIIRNYWQKELEKTKGLISSAEQELLKMIEDAKKEHTGELREMIVKELIAQLPEIRRQSKENMENFNIEGPAELTAIDDYLANTPEAELQKTAIPISEGSHRGFGSEKDGYYKVVVKNEDYFKKSLPVDAAQFILVWWDYHPHNTPTVYLKDNFEKNFDFEQIRAMVDN
jgi:hypothetical protein